MSIESKLQHGESIMEFTLRRSDTTCFRSRTQRGGGQKIVRFEIIQMR